MSSAISYNKSPSNFTSPAAVNLPSAAITVVTVVAIAVLTLFTLTAFTLPAFTLLTLATVTVVIAGVTSIAKV